MPFKESGFNKLFEINAEGEKIAKKRTEELEREEKGIKEEKSTREDLKSAKEEVVQEYEKKLKGIEKLDNSLEKMKGMLELVDKIIFRENTSPIKVVKEIESKYGKKIPLVQYYFDKNKKGEIINEQYQVNEKINEEKVNLDRIINMAIHEVRHRAQHTLGIELFTKSNCEEFFKEYPSLKFLIKSLPENLSPNDFDACIVEKLSSFLIKNGVPLSEISKNIIPKNAKEILKNIRNIKPKILDL